MSNQIVISPVNLTYRNAIIGLLQSEGLPVADLPTDLPDFFIATDNGLVIGAIGLEVYERDGLLRSLVVKKEYRSMNIAAGLVNELEKIAKSKGLKNIYLLTETAQGYFSKKGYETIKREDAPDSLKQSSE